MELWAKVCLILRSLPSKAGKRRYLTFATPRISVSDGEPIGTASFRGKRRTNDKGL